MKILYNSISVFQTHVQIQTIDLGKKLITKV